MNDLATNSPSKPPTAQTRTPWIASGIVAVLIGLALVPTIALSAVGIFLIVAGIVAIVVGAMSGRSGRNNEPPSP